MIHAYGQVTHADSTKRAYNNVITLDATGLLRQFFSFSTGVYYYYSPYLIGYKRIFKSNALRINLGGSYTSNSGVRDDTIHGKTLRYNYDIGIGYEHYCYLSKRWNLYFGADAIFNYSYNEYGADRTTTSSYKQTSHAYGYGVAPLVGIQFKITPHLSVSTETQYNFTMTYDVSENTNTPSSIYDTKSKSTGFSTQFIPPTSLIFRINI